MSDRPDSESEIEVTAAMLAAGEGVFNNSAFVEAVGEDFYANGPTAAAIYRAMRLVALDQQVPDRRPTLHERQLSP